MTDTIRIGLIGNPNTGKTSIFNGLCQTKALVGNYPGVTVEKKQGRYHFKGKKWEVEDLPGVYSLGAISEDERLALKYIKKGYDLLVFIADANNLKRNLYLLSQIVRSGQKLALVMTMDDLAQSHGYLINFKKLASNLMLPIIKVHGHDNLIKLKQFINENVLSKARTASKVNLLPLFGQPESTEFIKQRYNWVNQILVNVVEKKIVKKTWTERLDSILIHRFWGLLIFAGIMTFLFQSVYWWSGPLIDGLDETFSWLASLAQDQLSEYPLLASLVSDGMIAGVGSVLVFIPQIAILYAFIAILEGSGYLSRASLMMDRLLSWTGLNGRAFIPMLSCFACAIPGIMGARVMPDEKSRMTTILIVPFISCSARLPIYILFISTFIEPVYGALWASLAFFVMHAIGLIFALLLAWVFNYKSFSTYKMPFSLELPAYRMPRLSLIWLRTQNAVVKFTRQAGKVIFVLSVIIWASVTFPRAEKMGIAGQLEQSYLGRVGKAIQPLFDPLGYDWKLTIGIVGAFPAREVLISTLGIIYGIEDADEESLPLKEKLKESKNKEGNPLFDLKTSLSLMLFFALSAQCMSTLAVIGRELNSWKWPILVFIYMTVIAYLVAWLVTITF